MSLTLHDSDSFTTSVTPNILIAVPSKKEKLPLSITHPELANEADGWDPSKVLPKSNKKLQWQCARNHVWSSKVSHRTDGVGCPYCYGRFPIVGQTDLATTHPEIASQLVSDDPSTISFSSHKKMTWECDFGHRWTAIVKSRAGKSQSGCPVCSNNQVLAGFNDLATTHPQLALEIVDHDPTQIIAGSKKKYIWKCLNGHNWTISVEARVRGDGCPYCSGRLPVVGQTDLGTTNPVLASQLVGTNPIEVTAHSSKKLSWVCALGHIYKATVSSRSYGTSCSYCSNKKVLPGFNDLATTHPGIALEAYLWNPTKFIAGSETKKKWICPENHTYITSLASRTGKQKTGCPSCANSGFDPNLPGYLYFLEHAEWSMYQIGITNFPEKRLAAHRRLGWKEIEVRGPMDGQVARQWEAAVLKMLKAKGADLSNKKVAGKFDGYSEAWSKSTFAAKSIKDLMRLTEEFEEI